MSHRESPLYWSIPCGTWYDTRVRVSVFFVVLAAIICYRLGGLRLGLLFNAILLASVLLHEFGHIVAARLTHGGGNEVFIWPWGGVAAVQTAGTFQSRLLTPAAGPIVNATICAMAAWPVFHSGFSIKMLNPLEFPLTEQLANKPLMLDADVVFVLVFWTNWILLCINLLPVFPLDGGRMLQAALSTRWGGETAVEIYVRIGFVVGIVGIFAGLMVDKNYNIWLMLIGTTVLILNLQESMQLRTADGYDESFMGYDFSQGYTSLEQGEGSRPAARRAGLYQRWKEKRLAEKQRRRDEKDAEVAQQLDMLLQKVHTGGIDSLSDAERRQLDRASAHIRAKDQQKP